MHHGIRDVACLQSKQGVLKLEGAHIVTMIHALGRSSALGALIWMQH